ncbi:MAG: glycosyltransferase, partial [Amphiplicatus sp.]
MQGRDLEGGNSSRMGVEAPLALLVFGMHRSGTSSIAGLLGMLGADLPGGLLGPAEENKRGFFEARDIVEAHDAFLGAIGSAWSALDDFRRVDRLPAAREFKARIRPLLEAEFAKARRLVLKDPRMCRFAPLWLGLVKELGADPFAVLVIRNPLEIAASLKERNGFSPGRSVLLWLQHMLMAERDTRGVRRVFVDYDQATQDWRKAAGKLGEAVGLAEELDVDRLIASGSFLTRSLRNHYFQLSDLRAASDIPSWVGDVFETLESAARTGGEPDREILDAAWLRFEESRRLYNPVLRDHAEDTKRLEAAARDAVAAREGLQKEFAAEQARALQLETSLDALRAEAAALDAALRDEKTRADAALREAMAKAERGRAALSVELAAAQREIAHDQDTMARLEQRLNESSALGERLQRHVEALERSADEVRRSTSWRLTAPIRTLKRLVSGRERTSRPAPREGGEDSKAGDSRSAASAEALARLKPAAPTPVVPKAPAAKRRLARPVDVIIPVYRGLKQTRACVESVLDADVENAFELVVIDDCSPEEEVRRYVASLSGEPRITVLRNAENQGFVRTVNRGMSLHPDRDVVLLNSDTEVANDWLDRLIAAAHSSADIASATPYSNNATICSYPRYCVDNPLPAGLSLGGLDQIFAEANAGKTVDIPTAVGFCMYIRRDCLDEVGLFDAEAFGKGYGEENDFCMRAAARGWRHVLAADTFVFHQGSVSFSDAAKPLQEAASRVIKERYPDYFKLVADHVSQDPEASGRLAATALRYRKDARPVILFVTHRYGGGVERHIDDLKALLSDYALFLTLRPQDAGFVCLETAAEDGVAAPFHLVEERAGLVGLLRDFGVARVHIHHALGYGEALEGLIDALGAPFDFTAHDYYALCPRVHFVNVDGRFCGNPTEATCDACIATEPRPYDRTIADWRGAFDWLLKRADRAIAPSHDVARRMARYIEGVEMVVAPHVTDRPAPREPAPPPVGPGERLRVLLLGVLAGHKGFGALAECILAADREDAPVEFHLLGSLTSEAPVSDRFKDHSTYEDSALLERISEVDPHLIWFPAQAPETYSYTLEAALAANRPVAAVDIGSFRERLAGRPWTWIVPWSASAPEMLRFFERARRLHFMIGAGPAPPSQDGPALLQNGFYALNYLAPARSAGSARKRVVVVDHPALSTACG